MLIEVLLFYANALDNSLARELGIKRGVSGGVAFPHSFPSMVTKLGKSQRLRSYVK